MGGTVPRNSQSWRATFTSRYSGDRSREGLKCKTTCHGYDLDGECLKGPAVAFVSSSANLHLALEIALHDAAQRGGVASMRGRISAEVNFFALTVQL
jgi:hypothetical protein